MVGVNVRMPPTASRSPEPSPTRSRAWSYEPSAEVVRRIFTEYVGGRGPPAGWRRHARRERAERPTKRPYLFRGIVRCTACGRKIEASPRARGGYHRCPARTLAPGSRALATHPPTVYLREDVLQEAVNGWLGRLFAPENRDRTVAALVEPRERVARRTAGRRRKRASPKRKLR